MKTDINFIRWYKSLKEKGYDEILDLDDINDLVDILTKWYEFKYPDNDLKNRVFFNQQYTRSFLAQNMQFNDLLYRLSDEQISLIKGKYRGKGLGIVSIHYIGKKDEERLAITLDLYSKKDSLNSLTIVVNAVTGEVYSDFRLEEYIGKTINKLEGLCHFLEKKYCDEFDCYELKKCIFNHRCDRALLKKILHIVAINLIYSRTTSLQNGRLRATKMYEEFQKELHTNLLSIDDIELEKNNSRTDLDERQILKDKIDTKRMYEIEQYLKGEIIIDILQEKEINYLKLAKLMPFEEVSQDIEFFYDNGHYKDEEYFIRQLMKKYFVDEKFIRKRLSDVLKLKKYHKKIYKQLYNEQKRMIRRINYQK